MQVSPEARSAVATVLRITCEVTQPEPARPRASRKVERYPDHPGRTVLWAGAGALYGVRDHPDEDAVTIIGDGFL